VPIFIQIPIFFGLFSMLRSASELRFAEFLWIPDLSAPDTVAHIFGFPLNIMPLLMGVSMIVQMRMTPTPTVDNPSAKIMKFMPYMVTVMCYGFSSGLAVYWTASNLFSIFQQWVTNRSKDPAEVAPKPAEAKHGSGKPGAGKARPGEKASAQPVETLPERIVRRLGLRTPDAHPAPDAADRAKPVQDPKVTPPPRPRRKR
jgi:YidC/Oxa1 family membrane protein insertase